MNQKWVALFQTLPRYLRRIGLILAVPLAIFAVVELFFTSSSRYFPKACSVCHYEHLTVDSWQNSVHNEVSCSSCHGYRLGKYTGFILKYWTGLYSGHPIVDVKDKSCLNCHGEHILSDSIQYGKKITFVHAKHYGRVNRTVELRCSSCHTFVEGPGHMAVPQETCFLCHFKDVPPGHAYSGCPTCHGTPEDVVQHGGFVFSHKSYLRVGVTCDQCHLKVTKGDGAVQQRVCRNCHVERLEEFNDPFRVHEIHVTGADLKCSVCHSTIQHGEIQLVKTLEIRCENCHGERHTAQKEMYMGTGGKGVHDVPSRMFAAQVSCDGCHPKMGSIKTFSVAEDLRQKRQACVRCHGEGYDRMLDDWIRVMGRTLRSADKLVSAARARLTGRLPRAVADSVKNLMDEAQFNVRFVREGRGVHNIDYAVRLLKRSVSDANRALKLAGRSELAVTDRVLGTDDGYCMAFCHHIETPADVVPFERMQFPHKVHTDEIGLPCTLCHSPEKHKMRVITKSECMNCHHQQEDLACSTCHPYQQELYTGNIPDLGISGQPDVMAEAGVECTSCHDLSQTGEVLTLVSQSCLGCHEEGYDEMVKEWHNNLLDQMAEDTELLVLARQRLEQGKIPADSVEVVRRKIDWADKILTILDKAKPAHNPMLAEELLAQVKEALIPIAKPPAQ